MSRWGIGAIRSSLSIFLTSARSRDCACAPIDVIDFTVLAPTLDRIDSEIGVTREILIPFVEAFKEGLATMIVKKETIWGVESADERSGPLRPFAAWAHSKNRFKRS